MLVGDKNLMTLQLLDSVSSPVYAKKDTIIELVSNNESILKVPEVVLIKSGEYFKTIEVESNAEGNVEIAILSRVCICL